jgi:hypothetical protein
LRLMPTACQLRVGATLPRWLAASRHGGLAPCKHRRCPLPSFRGTRRPQPVLRAVGKMLTAFVSVACGRVPVPDVLIAVTALAHERPLITATLRH